MPDHGTEPRPRIALVFGDDAMVAHVREAMVDCVDIVYAASAAEFDASRLASTAATATLVNLDGGDWLGDVEAKLHAAGVAVVYNDSEISRELEGWERARWLRHLVAKLRGSRDVDPPRPETPRPSAPTIETQAVAPADECSMPPVESGVIERPLSPEEIETMTVDFVAEQESTPVRVVGTVPAAAVDSAAGAGALSLDAPEPVAGPPMALEPTFESPVEPAVAADVPQQTIVAQAGTEPAMLDFDAESALDVDTEALSAMIDARLAEPNVSGPSDSPEVWREVSGGNASPAQPEAAAALEEQAKPEAAPVAVPAAALNDDADVFASLPALDDWQLVDHDTAHAPAADKGARKAPEPVLSDAFAGLELVPMETVAPLRVEADPIERWFAGELGKPKAVANDSVDAGLEEASHEHG